MGQVAVDEKSNEITAIPTLLDYWDINGCILTIDAIGCQKAIAKKIVEDCSADYCLAVKCNQPSLCNEIQELFQDFNSDKNFPAMKCRTKVEVNRGRQE